MHECTVLHIDDLYRTFLDCCQFAGPAMDRKMTKPLFYWLQKIKIRQLLVGFVLVLLILIFLSISLHISHGSKNTEEHQTLPPLMFTVTLAPLSNTTKIWTSTKPLSQNLENHNNQFTPVPSVDCQSKPQSDFPFCNPSLSALERAKDLVSRLTTSEKIAQTSSVAVAIDRLGINHYNWRSNCLHGWAKSGGHWTSDLKWTVFPAPIGLGATFNVDLIYKVGQVTADEGRALHNVMMVKYNGSSTEAAGLNCFSPNVNLFRDPRWGRGQETFGEDPYLISLIGDAYTRGLQEGEDSKYLKVAACAKHYVVHSGPEEIRLKFTASVSLHDLYDTYLPAFKTQVLASKVAQIMPAYSGLRCKYQQDGAPDAANPFLLKTVLREQFGAANVSIVSDNGGVQAVYTDHKYVSSMELAAAVCMNATTDLDLGSDNVYPDYLQSALDKKEVRMDTINDAVVRSIYLRMRVGDFDPPSMVPYQKIDQSHLDTTDNQALNLQAARESMVLLKNLKGTLPLQLSSIKHLAVIGPNANAKDVLLSNYVGIPSMINSVLLGIEQFTNGSNITVDYVSGCSNVKCQDTSKFADALKIVQSADYVVMVMGLDRSVEGEGYDRVQTSCQGKVRDKLALPGCQAELVRQVLASNQHVILVLINGGPISEPELFDNDGVVGIIEAFYPGALGGTAVADVIFGNYNPAGRMPITTVSSADELPSDKDYNMSTSPGRTYKYYKNKPLIPFGFGLSFTEFEYTEFTVSPTSVDPCSSVSVSVSVRNVGKMAGDEVILIFVQPPNKTDTSFFPNVELLSFQRVNIKPSEESKASFTLNPYQLSLVNEDGEHFIYPGEYSVMVDSYINPKHTAKFTISVSSPVKIDSCKSSPMCFGCKG